MAALNLVTETYADKVQGAWLGKSIGVTYGNPLRGQLVPSRHSFYVQPVGQPSPNIGLDFMVAWLNAVEKSAPEVNAQILREAWQENLAYYQDEYGYASLNFLRGVPTPAAGAYGNWFSHATGAVSRVEIWAMLCPGNPQAASAFAYHDAVLDHCEEGVWAAMFLAAVQSASFFLKDTFTLLTIGLAMIPRTCRTSRAVKTVLAAAQRGATWMEARENVQHEVGAKNFTDAPQNIGFITIGLLYGMNDFGASLSAGVNCGYDAETIGGAIGATLGIMQGASAVPLDWAKPISDIYIPGIGVRNSQGILNLSAIAQRTVTVGTKFIKAHCAQLALVDADALPATVTLSEPSSQPIEEASSAASTTSQNDLEHRLDFLEYTAPPPAPSIASASFEPSSIFEEEPPTVPQPIPAEPVSPEPAPTLEQPAVFAPPETPTVTAPTPFTPQPISEEPTVFVEPEIPAQPDVTALPQTLAPDPMSAIAWADNSLVKPLLVTPTNAFLGKAAQYDIVLDTGDSPSIGYQLLKPLTFTLYNRGTEPFSGRISLMAPSGWQVSASANMGQRQYIPAQGSLRIEFKIQVIDGQGRIDIANSVVLRLSPDGGGTPLETSFVLMGASCWWTVGSFANFDGEGFDRSYPPEDRPGLHESYVAKNLSGVRWEKTVFPEPTLRLEPLFRGMSGVYYGQTILRSPATREARITASTNNGVKLWLNGALVLRRHQRSVFRPSMNDEGWSLDVNLRAGDNPILLKWVRGSEPYEFSLTLSDRLGRPMADVGNTTW